MDTMNANNDNQDRNAYETAKNETLRNFTGVEEKDIVITPEGLFHLHEKDTRIATAECITPRRANRRDINLGWWLSFLFHHLVWNIGDWEDVKAFLHNKFVNLPINNFPISMRVVGVDGSSKWFELMMPIPKASNSQWKTFFSKMESMSLTPKSRMCWIRELFVAMPYPKLGGVQQRALFVAILIGLSQTAQVSKADSPGSEPTVVGDQIEMITNQGDPLQNLITSAFKGMNDILSAQKRTIKLEESAEQAANLRYADTLRELEEIKSAHFELLQRLKDSERKKVEEDQTSYGFIFGETGFPNAVVIAGVRIEGSIVGSRFLLLVPIIQMMRWGINSEYMVMFIFSFELAAVITGELGFCAVVFGIILILQRVLITCRWYARNWFSRIKLRWYRFRGWDHYEINESNSWESFTTTVDYVLSEDGQFVERVINKKYTRTENAKESAFVNSCETIMMTSDKHKKDTKQLRILSQQCRALKLAQNAAGFSVWVSLAHMLDGGLTREDFELEDAQVCGYVAIPNYDLLYIVAREKTAMPIVKIATVVQTKGAFVTYLYSHMRDELTRSESKFGEHLDIDHLDHYHSTNSGDCGSPLYNETDRVVGIHARGGKSNNLALGMATVMMFFENLFTKVEIPKVKEPKAKKSNYIDVAQSSYDEYLKQWNSRDMVKESADGSYAVLTSMVVDKFTEWLGSEDGVNYDKRIILNNFIPNTKIIKKDGKKTIKVYIPRNPVPVTKNGVIQKNSDGTVKYAPTMSDSELRAEAMRSWGFNLIDNKHDKDGKLDEEEYKAWCNLYAPELLTHDGGWKKGADLDETIIKSATNRNKLGITEWGDSLADAQQFLSKREELGLNIDALALSVGRQKLDVLRDIAAVADGVSPDEVKLPNHDAQFAYSLKHPEIPTSLEKNKVYFNEKFKMAVKSQAKHGKGGKARGRDVMSFGGKYMEDFVAGADEFSSDDEDDDGRGHGRDDYGRGRESITLDMLAEAIGAALKRCGVEPKRQVEIDETSDVETVEKEVKAQKEARKTNNPKDKRKSNPTKDKADERSVSFARTLTEGEEIVYRRGSITYEGKIIKKEEDHFIVRAKGKKFGEPIKVIFKDVVVQNKKPAGLVAEAAQCERNDILTFIAPGKARPPTNCKVNKERKDFIEKEFPEYKYPDMTPEESRVSFYKHQIIGFENRSKVPVSDIEAMKEKSQLHIDEFVDSWIQTLTDEAETQGFKKLELNRDMDRDSFVEWLKSPKFTEMAAGSCGWHETWGEKMPATKGELVGRTVKNGLIELSSVKADKAWKRVKSILDGEAAPMEMCVFVKEEVHPARKINERMPRLIYNVDPYWNMATAFAWRHVMGTEKTHTNTDMIAPGVDIYNLNTAEKVYVNFLAKAADEANGLEYVITDFKKSDMNFGPAHVQIAVDIASKLFGEDSIQAQLVRWALKAGTIYNLEDGTRIIKNYDGYLPSGWWLTLWMNSAVYSVCAKVGGAVRTLTMGDDSNNLIKKGTKLDEKAMCSQIEVGEQWCSSDLLALDQQLLRGRHLYANVKGTFKMLDIPSLVDETKGGLLHLFVNRNHQKLVLRQFLKDNWEESIDGAANCFKADFMPYVKSYVDLMERWAKHESATYDPKLDEYLVRFKEKSDEFLAKTLCREQVETRFIGLLD